MLPILLLAAAAAQIGCPAERAQYRLRYQPEVTAWFRPVESGKDWPAGLAFAIRFGKSPTAQYPRSGRTYWWLPFEGGSDGRQNLASTTDVMADDWRAPSPDGGPRPHGNLSIIFADGQYELWDHIPHRGGPAPNHILIPDLRRLREGIQDASEKQFFDLIECTRSGKGEERSNG